MMRFIYTSFMSYCFVYILPKNCWTAIFSPSFWCNLFGDTWLNYNTVMVYKSHKCGDDIKATRFFWNTSSKAGLVCLQVKKGLAQGRGACSLLQRCLVCHLTVDCRAAIPPLANSSVIFSIRKYPRGHRRVWLCFAEARWGFSYKQVYRQYLYRLWHLTP